MRLSRLGGVVAALALLVLPVAPAAARGTYPPGIDADTIRTATPGPSSIAAGGAHSCALTSLGDLFCWGDDSSGQLGDGPRAHSVGRPVLALREAVQVDAGQAHTCAIDVRGAAHCWGDDSAGQLGDGARTDRATAVAVRGPAGRSLVQVSTGARHTCALDDEGGAWCWGDNSHGQLGRPGGRGSTVPLRVRMREPVVDIAAGYDTTCAVTAGGAVSCWGPHPRVAPVRGRAREVTVGRRQICVLRVDGHAQCWGAGARAVTAELSEISAGGEQTCGLDRAGRALCPDGRVRGDTPWRDLDVGTEHACAFDTRGSASCWGAGAAGQSGTDGVRGSAVPVPVRGLPRPPGTVTGLRVRALDGGLRVAWQPPADLGSGSFTYFWVTTAGYEAGCTLTDATAGGCELTGLRNEREYDVTVVVRTGDGLTMSDFVTATPAAAAPLPSDTPAPRRARVSVLPGSAGGPPAVGLSPVALVALGILLLSGGLAALLVRRS